jgi:putative solute:sodium symporter small subunit
MPELHRYADQYAPWVKSRTMLTLLVSWAIFSFGVQTFVRSLNKVTVPVLEMPLGMYLAVQGSLIVFAILLFWLAKRRPGPAA